MPTSDLRVVHLHKEAVSGVGEEGVAAPGVVHRLVGGEEAFTLTEGQLDAASNHGHQLGVAFAEAHLLGVQARNAPADEGAAGSCRYSNKVKKQLNINV